MVPCAMIASKRLTNRQNREKHEISEEKILIGLNASPQHIKIWPTNGLFKRKMRYQCQLIALCFCFCICVLVFFCPFISIRSNEQKTENIKHRKEVDTKSKENGKVNIIFSSMLKCNINSTECKLVLI